MQDVESDLHEVERCVGVTAADMLYPRWSIVIPILNERPNIERAVRSLVEVSILHTTNIAIYINTI